MDLRAGGSRAANDITSDVKDFWAILDSAEQRNVPSRLDDRFRAGPDGANVKPGDLETWADVERSVKISSDLARANFIIYSFSRPPRPTRVLLFLKTCAGLFDSSF